MQPYDKFGRPKVAVPISADDRLVANPSAPLLWSNFAEGSAVYPNPFQWRHYTSNSGGSLCGANTGFLVINSGAVITANRAWADWTLRAFRWIPGTSLSMRWRMKHPVGVQANAEMECGFGVDPILPTTTPSNGAFFRWLSTGFYLVTSENGTEVTSAQAEPSVDVVHAYEIIIRQDETRFLIDDGMTLDVTIPNTAGLAQPTAKQALIGFFRVENVLAAGPATAPQFFIADCMIERLDGPAEDYPTRMAAQARGAESSPITTYLQTATWANSAAPAAATLSNTAAGYATLGGLFKFVPVTGAETDYCLFGYQVPAGNNLVITGISIDAFVSSALGATYAALQWALGLNASAVSLATADGVFNSEATNPPGRAYRRVPLGSQAFLALAPAGTSAQPIRIIPVTPLVVYPGMYLSVIMRQLGATAGGEIRGQVGFTGYFD